VGHPEHFAEAFSTEPGLCYRLVQGQGGQPQQCHQPVVWRGRYRAGNGRWYRIWACDEHGEGLVRGERIRTGD
jgi:hypothetical protein